MLPIMLVLVPGILINYFFMRDYINQHETASASHIPYLQLQNETAALSEQLTQIHIRLSNALAGAITDRVKDTQLYRVQTDALDQLEALQVRVKTLTASSQAREASAQDTQLMLAFFEKYRNFVIMSADVAVVDPVAAIHYVNEAQIQFNHFSAHAFQLAALLAKLTEASSKNNSQLFDLIYERVTVISLIVLLASLLLSWLLARKFSRFIFELQHGLAVLSASGSAPATLPAIQNMANKETGEFKSLAQALLEYRNSIIQRAYAVEKLRGSEMQAKRALSDSLNQILALDQHCMVAISDTQGVIKYVNAKFCEMSEYAKEELIGQTFKLLHSGIHTEQFYSAIDFSLSNGKIWHGEICNKSKSGNNFWLKSSIVPLLDNKGVPQQYIALYTDITQNTHLIEELSMLLLQRDEQLTTLNEQLATAKSQIVEHPQPQNEQDISPSKIRANVFNAEIELRSCAAGVHILLIGDSKLLESTIKMLLQVGLPVDTAGDENQAIEMSKNTDYHLILLDMQTPQLDALAITRTIRNMPGRTTTPILAMASKLQQHEHDACLQAGINDILVSPAEAKTLYTTILKWLSA